MSLRRNVASISNIAASSASKGSHPSEGKRRRVGVPVSAAFDFAKAGGLNLSGSSLSGAEASRDADVAGPVPRLFPVKGLLVGAPFLILFVPFDLLLLLLDRILGGEFE